MRAFVLVVAVVLLAAVAAFLVISQPRGSASTYSLALGDFNFEKKVRLAEDRTDSLVFTAPRTPLEYEVLFLVPKSLADSADSMNFEADSYSVLIDDPVFVLKDTDGDGEITAAARFKTTSDASATIALVVPAGFADSLTGESLGQLRDKLSQLAEKEPTQREALAVEQAFNSAALASGTRLAAAPPGDESRAAAQSPFNSVMKALGNAIARITAERGGGSYAIALSPITLKYPLKEPVKIGVVTTRNITAGVRAIDNAGSMVVVVADKQRIKANTQDIPYILEWDGNANGKELEKGTYALLLVDGDGKVLTSALFDVSERVPGLNKRQILRKYYAWPSVEGLSLSDSQHADSITLRIVNPMPIWVAGVDDELQAIPQPTLKEIEGFVRSTESPNTFTHNEIPGLTLKAEFEGTEEPYLLKIDITASDISKVPSRVQGVITLDYSIWFGGELGIPLDIVKNCDDSVNVCYEASVCRNRLCDRTYTLYSYNDPQADSAAQDEPSYSRFDKEFKRLHGFVCRQFPPQEDSAPKEWVVAGTYPDLASCIEGADKNMPCYPLDASMNTHNLMGLIRFEDVGLSSSFGCLLFSSLEKTVKDTFSDLFAGWQLCYPEAPGEEFTCVHTTERECEFTPQNFTFSFPYAKQEGCEIERERKNKLLSEESKGLLVCKSGELAYCALFTVDCPQGELLFPAESITECTQASYNFIKDYYYLTRDLVLGGESNTLYSCGRFWDGAYTLGSEMYAMSEKSIHVLEVFPDEDSCREADKKMNAKWLLCRDQITMKHYCTQYGNDCNRYVESSSSQRLCRGMAAEYDGMTTYLCSPLSGADSHICTNDRGECKDLLYAYSPPDAKAACEQARGREKELREFKQASGRKTKFVFVPTPNKVFTDREFIYLAEQHFGYFNELAGTFGETELVAITERPEVTALWPDIKLSENETKITQWVESLVDGFDTNRDRIIILEEMWFKLREDYSNKEEKPADLLGKNWANIAYAPIEDLKTSAHEVTHSYGYCDEYGYDGWSLQNGWLKESGYWQGCANPYPRCCYDSPNYDGVSSNCYRPDEEFVYSSCAGSMECTPSYSKYCRSVMEADKEYGEFTERFIPNHQILHERVINSWPAAFR